MSLENDYYRRVSAWLLAVRRRRESAALRGLGGGCGLGALGCSGVCSECDRCRRDVRLAAVLHPAQLLGLFGLSIRGP